HRQQPPLLAVAGEIANDGVVAAPYVHSGHAFSRRRPLRHHLLQPSLDCRTRLKPRTHLFRIRSKIALGLIPPGQPSARTLREEAVIELLIAPTGAECKPARREGAAQPRSSEIRHCQLGDAAPAKSRSAPERRLQQPVALQAFLQEPLVLLAPIEPEQMTDDAQPRTERMAGHEQRT